MWISGVPNSMENTSYSFANSSSQQHSMITQSNNRSTSRNVNYSYVCSYCDYKAFQKCDIVKHERVHTGERPYKCMHCSYSATQKSSLKQHNRLHSGEKPFQCTICNYCSARKQDLNQHYKKHN